MHAVRSMRLALDNREMLAVRKAALLRLVLGLLVVGCVSVRNPSTLAVRALIATYLRQKMHAVERHLDIASDSGMLRGSSCITSCGSARKCLVPS
jgi:hypothetical protein